MSGIQVKGANEVIQNLSHYEDAVVRNLVTIAQVSQAKVINVAKSLVPVGPTGNLRNSIQPGRITIDKEGVTADVEARMFYASFVEYGTGPFTTWPDGPRSNRPWGMRPRPYLLPALAMVAPEYKKRITWALREVKI